MKTVLPAVTLSLAICTASPLFADPVSFTKEVAPILLNNCLACHCAKKAEGAYRIDTFERVVKAGESGANGVTASKPDDSELLRRIVTTDKGERMPFKGDPLPAPQIELIKRWITEGANFDGPDPKVDLARIVPPPTHPNPPDAYPHTLPITAVLFSPDGKQLVVGGYHELTVWNPEDGKLISRIKNVGERTYSLAVSPDGKTLAVGCGAPGRHGEARLFELASGNLIRVVGMTSDVVYDAVFNPAGDRIAVAAADSTIRIFEVATGTEQLAITSHSDWVMAVAWNADGTKLVSGSRDKTAKVFDSKTGELAATYSGHNQPVKGVAFHPNGKEALSSGADNKVHSWNIADGKKVADFASFGGEVFKLQTAGNFLFAGSAEKAARQIDMNSKAQVRSYAGHADWVLATAFHAETKRLATGTFDGEVRVWNTDDGKQVTAFLAAPGYTPPAK